MLHRVGSLKNIQLLKLLELEKVFILIRTILVTLKKKSMDTPSFCTFKISIENKTYSWCTRAKLLVYMGRGPSNIAVVLESKRLRTTSHGNLTDKQMHKKYKSNSNALLKYGTIILWDAVNGRNILEAPAWCDVVVLKFPSDEPTCPLVVKDGKLQTTFPILSLS